MTEQSAVGAYLDPDLRLEFPEPGFVIAACVPKSVVVRDPRKIVVARISITALAIRKSVSDRVVVISLNDRDSCLPQDFTYSIGRWAECTQISKTVKVLNLRRPRIHQESFESEMIAVDTAEQCDALRGGLSLGFQVLPFRWHTCRSFISARSEIISLFPSSPRRTMRWSRGRRIGNRSCKPDTLAQSLVSHWTVACRELNRADRLRSGRRERLGH